MTGDPRTWGTGSNNVSSRGAAGNALVALLSAVVGASGGPPRRFYALTAEGRAGLADELRRMDAVVRFARDRDLLTDVGGS